MIFYAILVSILYLSLVVWLLIGWERSNEFILDSDVEYNVSVSVIIPVRNEAKNILNLIKDISKQTYSKTKIEVLVVDDFSTDETYRLVEQSIHETDVKIKLFQLPEELKDKSNKKKAIEMAIKNSKGDLIVTTDGDCRVGPDWIKSIVQFKKESNAKLIAGPVVIESHNLWSDLQRIEFNSLIGSGAACINWGIPTMCNGANLAYEKSLFYEVSGFEGNEEIPSGDDEFLMHKMHSRYPGSIHFIKASEALVFTSPQERLEGFINQRIRWAGKWSYYQTKVPQVLAFCILLFNLSLLLNFFLTLCGLFPGMLFLEQLILKIFAEFVFLRKVAELSRKRIAFVPFIILELLYPIYVVIIAFAGMRGQYKWKGRVVN